MNLYEVTYELYFFRKNTVQVEAENKVQALQKAKDLAKANNEDFGGNLKWDSFKVMKKLQRK